MRDCIKMRLYVKTLTTSCFEYSFSIDLSFVSERHQQRDSMLYRAERVVILSGRVLVLS